jgi:hypothetical protein
MAFLNCKIWEIQKFPRYGIYRNGYALANIIDYCSETKEFQNNNVNIQIPEFELIATQEQLDFVHKYKDEIVSRGIPVILNTINNNEESWSVDLFKANFLQYLKR